MVTGLFDSGNTLRHGGRLLGHLERLGGDLIGVLRQPIGEIRGGVRLQRREPGQESGDGGRGRGKKRQDCKSRAHVCA